MNICLNLCCTQSGLATCYLRCEKGDGTFDHILQLCSSLEVGTKFKPNSPHLINLFPSSFAGITFGQVVLPMTYTGISCLPFEGRTLINFEVKLEEVCEDPSALYTLQRLVMCSLGKFAGEDVKKSKVNREVTAPFDGKWAELFKVGWRGEHAQVILDIVANSR